MNGGTKHEIYLDTRGMTNECQVQKVPKSDSLSTWKKQQQYFYHLVLITGLSLDLELYAGHKNPRFQGVVAETENSRVCM